jgi:hypothetical protein
MDQKSIYSMLHLDALLSYMAVVARQMKKIIRDTFVLSVWVKIWTSVIRGTVQGTFYLPLHIA